MSDSALALGKGWFVLTVRGRGKRRGGGPSGGRKGGRLGITGWGKALEECPVRGPAVSVACL